jgi:hypothetical protein
MLGWSSTMTSSGLISCFFAVAAAALKLNFHLGIVFSGFEATG